MDLPPMPSASVITQRKLLEQRLANAAGGSSENIGLSPGTLNVNNGGMSLAVPPSVLSAVSNNTDANIVAQLCGFDPFDLLNTVDFPNDRFERLLRVSKDARQLALRREEIPIEDLPDDESTSINPLNGNYNPSTAQFSRGSNLLNTVIEPTTKFSLDRNEGIKVELVSNVDNSAAVAEAKLKEQEVLKEQLARSAAAIMIQSFIRGFLIRRKFIAVVYAKLTVDSHDTDTSKVVSELPPVIDLNIQERVIRKFKHYVKIFEVQNNYLPDYPHFAAAKIQATFRMCVFQKKWKFIQALSAEEKNGNLGREAKAAMIRKAERADYKTSTYVKAVVKIQIAWRSFAARKVYHFYKNLIQFREAGSPSALLKYVNPKESKLIDTSCGIHMGGINASKTMDGGRLLKEIGKKSCWTIQQVELLVKLYEEGKKISAPDASITGFYNNDNIVEDLEDQENRKTQKPNKFETEDQLLQAMAELETELEHEFLMKWSEALDYDAYSHDWLILSTTGKSDEPNGYAAAITDSPLKNFINPDTLIQNLAHDSKKKPIVLTAGGGGDTGAVDPMLAEIDLFRKIAAETVHSTHDDGRSLISQDDKKKMRPWSGRSNNSLSGMFLRTEEF
ncbi:UNVERIFIED_CONTAM: hypothetical protein HDU68_004489 [Siphonaria sp. JEL0065]|nr:hypothetical protein HDU68_004489 [Siphonaria sp. JEL0065]